ncbi:MAG: hypothetical protein BWX51_02044 [Bacteroidetes bacterium ADurb.Bin012]|nr:MAG: hypothetical protein BWX51_02044 [Bacteroidetes bacterium ADurb.Bin012]
MKKYLFFAIFLASGVFTLNAQTKSELQIGLAMPQGDFADDDEDDAIFDGSGVASTGLYVGYKLLSPLKTDGLFWTLNAGIMYNDLQSDFKDDLEDEMDDADDFSLPKYLNVPILAGLQYEKSLSDGFKLFGEAGLGLNILKLTNLSASEEDYEYSMTFKPSVKLGYKIGAGIVLQDKYTISLNYLGLGSHKVKYESEVEYDGDRERDDDKFEKALSVSSLNITFGIRF